MKRPRVALATALMLMLMPFSGCLQGDAPANEAEEEKPPSGVFVTGPDGQPVDEIPLPLVFNFSDVG